MGYGFYNGRSSAFVWWRWLQWAGARLTGRFDGENYNIGLVTVTDTPYPELRAAAREVNIQLYKEIMPQ